MGRASASWVLWERRQAQEQCASSSRYDRGSPEVGRGSKGFTGNVSDLSQGKETEHVLPIFWESSSFSNATRAMSEIYDCLYQSIDLKLSKFHADGGCGLWCGRKQQTHSSQVQGKSQGCYLESRPGNTWSSFP